MIRQAYLDRIGYQGKLELRLEVLSSLHEHHMYSVPFENIDIYYGKGISLDERLLYQKIVEKCRGGFCYELNLLFDKLLRDLGFESRIIAARIFDSQGELGPAFDHMCLVVELSGFWLVDVGFGDLFLHPVALDESKIQTDGRNYFKVEKYAHQEYILLMSPDKTGFSRKYIFNTQAQQVSDFAYLCQDKQNNPSSYFVKNKICTRPTSEGRITLFNDKFILKKGEQKVEYFIKGEQDGKEILKNHFNISI